MIAMVTIENGQITGGYVRGDGVLHIQDDMVEWSQKWQVVLRPDAIQCQSNRTMSSGSINVVTFEVNLSGNSKLALRTSDGERKIIRRNRVFAAQNCLDGQLYLIYNANGYRSAYFFSKEYMEWKDHYKIVNVVDQDPNELEIREKIGGPNAVVFTKDDISIYACGKRTLITDGNVRLEKRPHKDFNEPIQFARVENASWVIFEKARKNRCERILLTNKSVFDLKLPELQRENSIRCSGLGLEALASPCCMAR